MLNWEEMEFKASEKVNTITKQLEDVLMLKVLQAPMVHLRMCFIKQLDFTFDLHWHYD